MLTKDEPEEEDQIFEGNEYILRKHGESLNVTPDIIYIESKDYFKEIREMFKKAEILIDLGAK